MDKPEALLVVNTYGNIAVPMSMADKILPYLKTLKSKYEDGVTVYHMTAERMDLRFLSKDEVTAMLVANKMDNKG